LSTAELRQFLMALNRCWTSGDHEALAAFYHPDVVLLPPDLGAPIRGRDAVVASYREFADSARLLDFQVTDLDLHSFSAASAADDGLRAADPAARADHLVHMAHMRFDVTYELAGSRYQEQGLEIYTVLEGAGGLEIVWRAQLVLDSRLADRSGPSG
jgi:hypothetical protein